MPPHFRGKLHPRATSNHTGSLVSRRLTSLPTVLTHLSEQKPAQITERKWYCLQLLNVFWERWTKDNVLQLSFHRAMSKFILIRGKSPRVIWMTGIIAEAHPGCCGVLHVCKVQTLNGQFLTSCAMLRLPKGLGRILWHAVKKE